MKAGALLAVFLTFLAACAVAASAQNLPKRQLVVTGGSFLSESYIDVGAFTPPVFPLDDRQWIGTPQMSILCYAPSVSKDEFAAYTHMEDVVYPVIWYYPLEHILGGWKYEYGDTLTCELWECDGAPDGCDPSRPNALPNPKAGDDLLGRAVLEMSDFTVLSSHLLNFTVPSDGKGEAGDDAAAFLVQCKGCRETWERDPNYVNPYVRYQPENPEPQAPPADTPGTLPWRPEPVPGPVPTIPPIVSTPPTLPPIISTPPATSGPSPPLPWRDEDENVQPFDGPQQTDASGGSLDTSEASEAAASGTDSGSGSNTLVIVLAVLGGLVGALILALCTYFVLKKCRYRAVEPELDEQNEKEDAVARHLRIRVARPAEAEAAINAAKGDAAMAELPWTPETKH